MLTPEQIAFLERHAGSVPDYEPTTLHALFSAQAARTPDAEALCADDRSLTYRQVENAANALARALTGVGAGSGRPVAVSGERGLELFIALLAVLKAGSAILYLDPHHPADYHRAVLKTAEARILVPGPGSAPEMFDPDFEIVLLDGVLDEADRDQERVADHAGYEDPAYVIFTSGTTGTPKGVVRPHRMHVTRIALEQGMYHLGAGDRILLKSPISFREFLWPLAVGATAVIARGGGERDDRYLIPFLAGQRISVVSFVPSMLRVLVANPDFPALAGSLRHIFAGGERLPADLEKQLRGHGFEVHNTYTLTEADYVAHRKDATDTQGRGSVVGRPLDMRVYLCDESGKRVAPGEIGEILTGGPGLATGYLNRPDLTAERFVPNPFDTQVPVLFRTGDLARFLPDGQIDYIGRADLQIKVRGQRVEPTAVESVIREHPAVRDAVAVGFPDQDQGARLVAFATAQDAPVPVDQITVFLRERLPDFMVPASLVWLEKLPLLLSGKVDRGALVPRPGLRPDLQNRYVAPRTPQEARLAVVWRRVLGVTDIGVDDKFTEIGGDSLRLLILRSMIEQEFGCPVQIADLLDNATIRVQAVLVSAGGLPSASDPRAAASAKREAALDQRRRRAESGSAAVVEPS